MACDICGKVGVSLVPLNTDYQTDAIKDICGTCESEVNTQLWKIRTLNHGFLRRWLIKFMENRKAAKRPEK